MDRIVGVCTKQARAATQEPRPVSLLDAVGDVGARNSKRGDTTVMLRNLPNNYSRNMVGHLRKTLTRPEATAEVCTMMDKEGFHGKYDFLYLPIDSWLQLGHSSTITDILILRTSVQKPVWATPSSTS